MCWFLYNVDLLHVRVKVGIGESPSKTHEIFETDDSNNYNLRKNKSFKSGHPKTIHCGTKTISVIGPKLRII